MGTHLREQIREEAGFQGEKRNFATGKDSKILNCDPKTQDKTPTDNDIIFPTKNIYIAHSTKTKILIGSLEGGKGGAGGMQRSTDSLQRLS